MLVHFDPKLMEIEHPNDILQDLKIITILSQDTFLLKLKNITALEQKGFVYQTSKQLK